MKYKRVPADSPEIETWHCRAEVTRVRQTVIIFFFPWETDEVCLLFAAERERWTQEGRRLSFVCTSRVPPRTKKPSRDSYFFFWDFSREMPEVMTKISWWYIGNRHCSITNILFLHYICMSNFYREYGKA